jgi:hypothetical protein
MGSNDFRYHLHINKHGMHISFSLKKIMIDCNGVITSVEMLYKLLLTGNSLLAFITSVPKYQPFYRKLNYSFLKRLTFRNWGSTIYQVLDYEITDTSKNSYLKEIRTLSILLRMREKWGNRYTTVKLSLPSWNIIDKPARYVHGTAHQKVWTMRKKSL